MENSNVTAWMKLYHPSGVDVRIPMDFLPLELETGERTVSVINADCFKSLLDSVTNALAVGWLAAPPLAEEGETIEEIGYVVRADVDSRSGGVVPRIDLYVNNDQMRYRLVSVYLNTQDERDAFERVSGLKIQYLPLYVGTGYIERGKARQTDSLITKAPRPFKVGYKPNPAYDPKETDLSKKKASRLFTRWPELSAPPGSAPAGKTGPELISKPEYDQLSEMFQRAGVTDMANFLNHFKISKLSELPRSAYGDTVRGLNEKIAIRERDAAEAAARAAAEAGSGHAPYNPDEGQGDIPF